MLTILSAAWSSPKGLGHSLLLSIIMRALFSISSGSTPATTLAPTSTVSGLSVFSLMVTQGTFNMQASSWTPPESVSILEETQILSPLIPFVLLSLPSAEG